MFGIGKKQPDPNSPEEIVKRTVATLAIIEKAFGIPSISSDFGNNDRVKKLIDHLYSDTPSGLSTFLGMLGLEKSDENLNTAREVRTTVETAMPKR